MQSSSQECKQILERWIEENTEEGTDKDLDKYAVEVQNGDGYYNSEGKFIRYKNND